jgi:hypothetical protein
MGVTITKDRLLGVLRDVHAMAASQVLIGIPESEDERNQRDADGSPLGNAAIGYIQETGSPANNLPARPFLVPGVELALKPATAALKSGAKKVLDGESGAGEKAMHVAGLIAQNAVRAKINSGVPPALAESTLAGRRRRGRTGTTPLIDTGQVRNAITYVIREK